MPEVVYVSSPPELVNTGDLGLEVWEPAQEVRQYREQRRCFDAEIWCIEDRDVPAEVAQFGNVVRIKCADTTNESAPGREAVYGVGHQGRRAGDIHQCGRTVEHAGHARGVVVLMLDDGCPAAQEHIGSSIDQGGDCLPKSGVDSCNGNLDHRLAVSLRWGAPR